MESDVGVFEEIGFGVKLFLVIEVSDKLFVIG